MREGVLVAQRFDPEEGTVRGEPIPIAQGVGLDEGVLRGAFAAAGGVLAHRSGGGGQRQLAWVDRAGIAHGTVGAAR